MTTLFTIDLETGDLSQFDATAIDGGDLSASGTAALNGSYGLLFNIDDTNFIYGRKNITKQTTFHFGMRFDPNSITMSTGDSFAFMALLQQGSANYIAEFDLNKTSLGYNLSINVGDDSNPNPIHNFTISLTDEPHTIELTCIQATNSSSSDGSYIWYLDGAIQYTWTGLDNYNRMFDANWYCYIAANYLDAGTSGTFYIDDIIGNDDATAIFTRVTATGFVLPQSATTANEAPWEDNDWSNPTNIETDDTNAASVTASSFDSPDQTYVLKGYNFDFSSIPSGATIDGVVCVINARYANGTGSIDLSQLLDTSLAKGGDNKASTPLALTTSPVNYTFGVPDDKWSLSLTDTWIKNSNFGVAIGMLATGANADVFVYYVALNVYYTEAASPVTIVCSAGSLSSAGQSSSVAPGGVDIPCSAGVLAGAGEGATVAPGEVVVACNEGTLASAGESASISSEVSISCSEGTLASSGESASVVPGEVVVACNEGTLASAGESASVTSETSVPCSAGVLASAGESGSVVPGAVSVACAVGVLASNGESATIVPGGVNIACGAGVLAGNGESASISTVTGVACNAGVLASTGESASVVPGAVSVACAVGVLASNGESATIVPGGVNIACGAGILNSNGESATIVPGGVNIACGAGVLAGNGESANISTVTGVACNAGILASAGESATVVPGAVNIACGAGVLASNGESASISTVTGVACNAGTLASAGESASLLVESVIQCSTGTLVLGGESVSVAPGGVDIACGVGVIVSYGWKGGAQAQVLDVGYIETVISGQVGFSENELKNLPDSEPASGYYNPDKAIDEDGIYYEHEIGKIEP